MQGIAGKHRDLDHRYYQIAGITIRMESDLPIMDTTFHPKFKHFEVNEPGDDSIILTHHFFLPDLSLLVFGKEIYRHPPWTIYQSSDTWTYVSFVEKRTGGFLNALVKAWHAVLTNRKSNAQKEEISKGALPNCIPKRSMYQIAIFNADYTVGTIFNKRKFRFRRGRHTSLSLFPTDQIFLAHVLANRQGCYFHAGGVVLDGKGLLFMGHSQAGKTTIVSILKKGTKILCDDRIIVRRWPEGFRIHGTWSHGDLPDVSGESAPLKAVLFLEQSPKTRLAPLTHKKEVVPRLLDCLIKPYLTADWWERMLPLVTMIADQVPCYQLFFNKSGDVFNVLQRL